jgi:hypothetical protein
MQIEYMDGVSNCCGAPVYYGERCSECMEGCGLISEEEYENDN